MAANQLAGQVMNACWVDVGTPERLNSLESKLRSPECGGDD